MFFLNVVYTGASDVGIHYCIVVIISTVLHLVLSSAFLRRASLSSSVILCLSLFLSSCFLLCGCLVLHWLFSKIALLCCSKSRLFLALKCWTLEQPQDFSSLEETRDKQVTLKLSNQLSAGSGSITTQWREILSCGGLNELTESLRWP